jgi:hypothetical protein
MFHELFKTRDPSVPIFPIDEARVEVLLNCFDAPQLITSGALQDFVRSLHGATEGNPDILPLLVLGFERWQEFDNERERATIAFPWNSFDDIPPAPGSLETLKAFCTAPPHPLPPSMVHAIFDDPSFDFYAYLNWHGNLLGYSGEPN